MSTPSKHPAIVRNEASGNLVLTKTGAEALLKALDVAREVVRHEQYRASLDAIVRSLAATQAMRHDSVNKLVDFLREFGPTMSKDTRDQLHLAIIPLLQPPQLSGLPLPPR